MNKRNSSEPKNAQSQMSQEVSNNTETSTIKIQKQVDSSTKATIDNQQIVQGNGKNENLNSERNTNSFAHSEDLDSDYFILSSNDSEESDAASNKEQSESTGSKIPVLLTLPHTIVSEEQLNASVENFIENTASVNFMRAEELLDCADSISDELAARTVKYVGENIKSGWLLIGIAAYRIWNKTVALSGGYKKNAKPGEGRMNALKSFADKCAENGSNINYKTLYAYIGWVKKLLEEPLEQFRSCDKKTILRERTDLMDKLFRMPPPVAKLAAYGKFTPSEAMKRVNIAYQAEIAKGKVITGAEFKQAIKEHNKQIAIADNCGNEQNDGDVPALGGNDNINTPQPMVGTKAVTSSSLKGLLASQVEGEAKRLNIESEQIRELYESFLQMMLSTVQDLGVEK